MTLRIFTQKHEKLNFHPWVKRFYQWIKFFICQNHPMDGKILSMDAKILSMDKSVIHGKNDG